MVRVFNHRIHVEIDPTLPKALNSCPTYRQKQNAGVITFNIFKDVCGMWNDNKSGIGESTTAKQAIKFTQRRWSRYFVFGLVAGAETKGST